MTILQICNLERLLANKDILNVLEAQFVVIYLVPNSSGTLGIVTFCSSW